MKELLKLDYLENMVSVSILDTIVALFLAYLIGIFIYEVYKKTHQGVMRSSNFGLSLIALTMISTFVVLAVTTNVVLSLGMVGALSIVRFRTAIKDPLDTIYFFWSISSGIVLAAQMIFLAIIGSLLIGIMLLVYSRKKNRGDMYILILKYSSGFSEENVKKMLDSNVKAVNVKNKIVTKEKSELHYEIILKDNDTSFMEKIFAADGVEHAAMLSYNGDYAK